MMKIVKEHYKKCIFLISISPGIIISLIQAILEVKSYRLFCNSIKEYQSARNIIINPHWAIYSIYQIWIGNNLSNVFSTILFYVFPIDIALFCILLCKFDKSNINNHIKGNGILHVLYNFVMLGSIPAIPLLFNFMILHLFIPVVSPDSVYNSYYGYFSKDFLSHTFYTYPFIYIILFLVINFIYGGLIGSISLLISQRTNKAVMILPEVLLIIIEMVKKKLCGLYPNIEVSPLSIIFPAKSHATNWLIIITEMLLLCLIVTILLKDGKNNEKSNC